MSDHLTEQARIETDSRFPSGPWTGFYLQPPLPGRFLMEKLLLFKDGSLTGSGRDLIGSFICKGRYEVASGLCHWTKSYLGKHDVFYQGQNQEGFIHGEWTIPDAKMIMKGGFVIWPEGMEDPTKRRLHEAVPLEELLIQAKTVQEQLLPIGNPSIGDAEDSAME